MEMITRKEAWEITGYSRAHFQRLVNAGRVPKPVARIGRSWMYDRAAIEAFAALKKPSLGGLNKSA
jgi:predicted DNA-binding transcriptional regulator AlpA